MPEGKAAGVRCVQLDEGNLCQLFGHPDRPAFCLGFRVSEEVCGGEYTEAMANLIQLERMTSP